MKFINYIGNKNYHRGVLADRQQVFLKGYNLTLLFD